MARLPQRRTWSEWFRGGNKTKARKRLAVEILEDRSVPATVTNLLDGTDPFQPIPGSLRAAIIEASRDTGPNAGKVDFDPGLFASGVPQTLVLNGAVGAIVVNSGVNISITGPGAGKLRIQSDYGFTPGTIIDIPASPAVSGYKAGQSLRQVPFASPAASGPTSNLWTRTSTNDTTFSAPPPGTKNENYFGAAVFQVSEVNGSGAITKVSIQNGGSNSIWRGTLAAPISGSSTDTSLMVADASLFPPAPFDIVCESEQMHVTWINLAGNSLMVSRAQAGTTIAPHAAGTPFSLESRITNLAPLAGTTGTGASSFTVPASAYSLNPGLFTLQMPSSGAFTPTFTLSGLTFGATLGDAITQNSGHLAVQSCEFVTTDFRFGGTTPLVQSFISAPANSSVRNITVADSTFTGALAAAISHDSTGTVSVTGLSATNTAPLPALANTSSAPTTASLSSASNVITASAVNNLIGSASVTAGFPASATLSSSVPSPNAGIPYGTARTIQAEDAASGATALLQDDGFLRSVRVQSLLTVALRSQVKSTDLFPLPVTDASSFPIGSTIFCDSEQMRVTAVDTVLNTLTVQRAQGGTTATTHASGAALVTTPGVIVSQALPASPAPLASSPIGGVVFINGVAVQSFSGAAANGMLTLTPIGTPSAAQVATAASYDPATRRVTLTYAATPAGTISLEVAHTVSEINLGGSGTSMVRAANILQAAGTELAVAVAGAPGTASQVRLVSINADGTLTSVRSISLPLGTPAPVSIAAGDVNGDGFLESSIDAMAITLVVPNNPSFPAVPFEISCEGERMTVTGITPIAGTINVQLTVTRNPGTAVAHAAGSLISLGTIDLGLLSSTGLVTILRGTRNDSDPYPSRLFATTQLAGSGFTRLALADLNNDGHSDAVAVASASATITTALGTTTGGLSTPRVLALPAGSTPAGLAMADIDNDGKQDITIALPGSNLVNTYFGRGTGEFYLNPLSITGLSQPSAVIAANLAGSSLPDILITSQGNNGVILYENLGDQRFRPASNRTTVFSGNAIAIQTGANNRAASVSISAADFSGNGTGSGTGPLSLRATGAVTIANSRLTANQGASTVNTNGTVTFSDSVLANNSTSGAATGAILALAGSKVDIANSRVTGNNPGPANTAGTVSITAAAGTTISSTLVESNIPATSADTRAVNVTGPGSVSNSVFKNNSAGGALAVNGNWTVDDSWFGGNAATANNLAANKGGAAIRSNSGKLSITKSVFDKNTYYLSGANSGGGAVYFTGGNAIGLTVTDSSFQNNAAVIGNNLYTSPVAPATYAGLSGGGAIRSGSSATITGSFFANNAVLSLVNIWSPPAASQGTPVYSGGGALLLSSQNSGTSSTNPISNTTFYQNSVAQLQAAPGTPYANLNLSGISVPASPGTGRGLTGGAILLSDTPTTTSTTSLINTTISANSVDNPFAATVNSNVGVNPNLANDADSGGIFNDTNTGSAITLTNMINVANTGILYDPATGTPSVGFANFGNRAISAGGRGTASASFSLYNPAFNPGLASTGNNLLASEQNSGLDPRGLITNDPDLSTPPAKRAGTTPVIGQGNTNSLVRYVAPDRLSPARDTGTTTGAPATDVRGLSRNINFAVDMGAVELQTVTKVTVDPATLPPGNTLEYGQTDDITIQVAFDDSKANANPVTGKVHIVTKTDDKITGYFGTATLTAVAGAPVPTGQATIQLNGDLGILLSAPQVTLYAIYEGDSNYAASDSLPFTLTVNPATTAISFDSGPLNVTEVTAASISLTGSVAVAHPGGAGSPANLVPTGAVQFSIKPLGSALPFTVLHSVPVFGGRFDSTNLPSLIANQPNGVYIINAEYIPTDPLQFAPTSKAIKQEVGITPGITVTVSSNTVQRGAPLTITASLNPENNDIHQPGSITITKDGADFLTIPRANATSGDSNPNDKGVYSITIDTADDAYALLVSPTPYVISARYNRNDGGIYNTTTSTSLQNITIVQQTTNVRLTSSPSGPSARISYGDSFLLVAQVNPGLAGSPIPFSAGTMRFENFDGVMTSLVPAANNPQNFNTPTPPVASIGTQSMSVGNHSITAVYSGGGDYAGSTSNIITLQVDKAPSSTSFASSPSPAIVNLGSSITFNIVIATPAINAPQKPSGSVVFSNTAGVIATVTVNQSNGIATYTYTPNAFTTGDTITATYSGDGNYLGSSNTLIVTVPSLTLAPISATPVQRGGAVTLTATIDPADSNVNQPGSVDFFYGSVIITSVPRSASTVVNGRQVYSVTINTGDNAFSLFVNTNPYLIQARYNQNGGNFPSTISNTQSLSVISQDTSTALSINPGQTTFSYGDRIDISAQVTPAVSGSAIPFAAGALRFDDGAAATNPINGPITTPSNSNPFASFSTASLSVGTHSLTASYSGDGANYNSSTSDPINIVINKASSSISFSSNPSPAIVNLGNSVVFNVTVSTTAINAPLKPSGLVEFSNSSGIIFSAPVNQSGGIATFIYTPSAYTPGDAITATYSGDTNYTGASSTLIVTVPSLTLSPIAASPVQRGNPITLTATMDPADNNVNQPGSVDFLYGSTVITSVPRSGSTVVNGKQVYSASINTGDNAFSLFVNANPYSIQARYNQNGGNVPTVISGVQTLTVITQNTTTSVASPLFPLQASGSLVYGNRFDLSAALAPAISRSIIPFASQATGIRILDNGVVIATLPISNDSRSPVFSKTDFAVGTHVLTAQFIGDGNYAMSTSQPFTLTVTPASTSINLTSAADYLALGQTFTLNASILSNAQTMPTQISGVVNFTAIGPGGTANLLPGAISIGKASSTFTPTLPGKYTITANYLGDANYQASSATRSLTASSISIEVTDANGSQTISTAPRGSSVTLTARLTPADSSAIDTLTGLPVQPGSVSFRLSNGTVITAVARQDSNSINGSQVYSATINTGNNLFSLPVGVATISARYNANGGLYPQVDSATPAILTVTRQATTTALSTPSVTSIPYGSAVSFSAAVAPVIAATGADAIPFGSSQIQFFNASALIQTSVVNDANRSSTLSLDLLPVGSYLISARYAGDNANYLASRSTDSTPAFALGVTQASTSTTLSLSSPAIDSGSSVLLTATVGSGVTGNALRPSGTVNFFNNGTLIGSGIVNPATGVVQFSYRPPTVGGYSLSASYAGDANYSGSSSAASSSLVVNTFQPFYAIAMQGGSKFATFNTRTNALIATYQPNGPRYTGGFTLARGDVNGDGVADLLWATNRGSFVRIIDGLTSHDLGGFFGFNSNFNSPISIAVGDINKDGKGDIMVAAAGRNAGGVVRVYSGASFGQLLYQGSPYGERFGGGISLASGDVDGDGWADIISSPLSAGVARVVVVSGKTQSTIRNFLAQTPGYTGGISVAAADINNDGLAEIITATNSGRGIVSVFDGSAPFNSGVQAPALGQLVIGGPRFTGGARVAVVSDINGDGIPDLLTTMGPGGGTGATRYSFNATTRNFQLIDSLFAFSSREPGANNGLRPA